MQNFELILLQAEANPLMQFAPLILVMIIIYFFMIRPQQKKAKEQAAFQDDLKRGDNVSLSSGILGKIDRVEEDFVYVEIASKTVVKVTRNAVSKELTDAINGGEAA